MLWARSRARAGWVGLALFALTALVVSRPASALDWFDGRLQMHGFYAMKLRFLSDGYSAHNWYNSQWAHTLNLEIEADLAPDGFGPLDLVQAFARVEVRYECVFTGCGISGSHRYFGDRATRAPARNWTGGFTGGYSGDLPDITPLRRIHEGNTDLLTLAESPLLQPLFD